MKKTNPREPHYAIRNYYLLFFSFVSVIITSCQKEGLISAVNLKQEMESKVVVGSSTSEVTSQTLYAGQSINAGSVSYDDIDTNNDQIDDALKVTFETKDGWELTSIHFFIGGTLAQLPVNKSGNPQPGQFPYKTENLTGISSYSITIPFSSIGFSCPNVQTEDYFVSAHAGLRKLNNSGSYQTESGWGDGQRLVQRGSWAMFNVIYISCDETQDPIKTTTETAFAFNGDQSGCFQNFSEFIDNPSRWGWTNGPYANGNYTIPIYAGAGQCDISKGVMVGNLELSYSGTNIIATYKLTGVNPKTGAPYSLKEAHLYAGNDLFAKIKSGAQAGEFTIAPGKFPYKASELSGQTYTFTINNVTGDIHIIAHAVIDGFPLL